MAQSKQQKRQSGLSRGLDSLLGGFEVELLSNPSAVKEVEIGLLYANPDQPRKLFDQERLEELAGSIRSHGIVQPLVVKRTGESFMIITGERRYRAAKIAGLDMVPVVERTYEEDAIHEIALIENIQREDLNPVEEAAAIAFLMKQHDLTQEEVAARLSKSRPAVANTLRLLHLPELVKDLIKTGQLSAGHGRALSALDNIVLIERLAKQAVESGCSVRAMEQIVKASQNEAAEQAQKEEAKKTRQQKALDSDLYEVETRLRETLKTKVKINGSKKRGKITIEYYSMDALQEIYDLILGE